MLGSAEDLVCLRPSLVGQAVLLDQASKEARRCQLLQFAVGYQLGVRSLPQFGADAGGGPTAPLCGLVGSHYGQFRVPKSASKASSSLAWWRTLLQSTS